MYWKVPPGLQDAEVSVRQLLASERVGRAVLSLRSEGSRSLVSFHTSETPLSSILRISVCAIAIAVTLLVVHVGKVRVCVGIHLQSLRWVRFVISWAFVGHFKSCVAFYDEFMEEDLC